MNRTRRSILRALEAGPASGPDLAAAADISRAAVWKHVEALRQQGFSIDSTADGYVVTDTPEYGSTAAIEYGRTAPYQVRYYDELSSTNQRARELAAEGAENIAVVAGRQTNSRGRLDRPWQSPDGAVSLSILLRPDRPPAHAPLFTLAAAVATVDVARSLGVDAAIKWPNDVIVPENPDAGYGGRKLCGILTEMEGEADRISWLVVGIGLNADIDAAELPDNATSIRSEIDGPVDRGETVRAMLAAFDQQITTLDSVLDAWRDRSVTLGMPVRVETHTDTITGIAEDIVMPGALQIDTGEGIETVHAGDCEHLRPNDRHNDSL
ncbi:biotin--[acetyl-CoA-carboxylase] ligase [Halalkalirubrum salinum]|uniref:biotin--[acetyl-CoA-carboxylase] ligase n=1 Tax=Halalkalirubrum salinum TaxID=2563889 RepID=UPI0010FAF313|nr:biotin--[acetyl-CoA-carboxylase] ligase [Halalkalirubrum salinum]